MVNISFYRAVTTPPGSLPIKNEWDLVNMDMFKAHNEHSEHIKDIRIEENDVLSEEHKVQVSKAISTLS